MSDKIERFEDLKIWQRSMDFVGAMYDHFRDLNDFGFRNQIQRAAVSVPANISEGFERHSNKEYIRFLYIARGSSGECRTLLYLAKRLNYMNENIADKYIEESRQISSMIYGLIKTRQNNF